MSRAVIDGSPGRHAICGYVIHADYPIHGLPVCTAEQGSLGMISVVAGDVPEHLDPDSLDHTTLIHPTLEVSPHEILIKPYDGDRPLGRILVRGGREIIVAPAPGANLELEPFILGSGVGGISLQRGLLPLHASAVSIGSTTIAFVGPTGAGKSTLVATLVEQGHTLVADDLTVVRVTERAAPLAYPSAAIVKLNADSASALGIEERGGAMPGRLSKRQFPMHPSAEPRAAVALDAIYILEQGDKTAIHALPQISAFAAIADEAYRRGWFAPMGLFEARMKDIAVLSRQIGCFRLVRPHRFDAMAEVIDALLSHGAGLSSAA
ncbi:MAG: hypothetical protein ABI240_00300 [Sphingomonas sp.]